MIIIKGTTLLRYNDPQFLEGRQPENGKKKLNWTVFLALFAVFSSDERTLKMLDSMEVFQRALQRKCDCLLQRILA